MSASLVPLRGSLFKFAVFIADVREARRDMEAVFSRASHTIDMSYITVQRFPKKIKFPATLCDVVQGCDHIVNEMAQLLEKLRTREVAPVRWTISTMTTSAS